MAHRLSLQNLSLRYPGSEQDALAPLTLDVERSEILALTGPSGSGKSSLLRLLAGLERPTTGSIHVGQSLVADPSHHLPPEKRQIGLASQGGDLFPHLTVADNIAYGLFRSKRSERKERVKALLDLVSLSHLSKRYPAELSGGEAQRIALARALAPKPKVLLLDEPFSSLDAELRENLRDSTLAILRQEGTTTIFVTHHREDAEHSCDRVVSLTR